MRGTNPCFRLFVCGHTNNVAGVTWGRGGPCARLRLHSNTRFPDPLTEREAASTAYSVSTWIWSAFNEIKPTKGKGRLDHSSVAQSWRGTYSGIARRRGTPLEKDRQPWNGWAYRGRGGIGDTAESRLNLLIRGGDSRGVLLSDSNRVKRRVLKCKRGKKTECLNHALDGGGGLARGLNILLMGLWMHRDPTRSKGHPPRTVKLPYLHAFA